MHQITRFISFSYGHRLLEHKGKCKHLHGHNGKVEIELSRESLDDMGMVMDFYDVKTSIKAWIDDHLDHRMILCEKDPYIEFLEQKEEPLFIMKDNPTAENIAKTIFEAAKEKGLPVTRVTLWETESASATYIEK